MTLTRVHALLSLFNKVSHLIFLTIERVRTLFQVRSSMRIATSWIVMSLLTAIFESSQGHDHHKALNSKSHTNGFIFGQYFNNECKERIVKTTK